MINTGREWKLLGFEYSTSFEETYTLETLLTKDVNGTEVLYSLQERNQLDLILEMKVGETLFVSVNRDTPDNRGVLLRVK